MNRNTETKEGAVSNANATTEGQPATPERLLPTLAEVIVSQVPQLARGRVWCITCGRTQEVDAARSLLRGWPRCCGYTMTIDSPTERAAQGSAPAGGDA